MSPSVLNAKHDNSQDRDHFLSQYNKQQIYSFSCAHAARFLGAVTPLLALTKHPAAATACAISAVCIGAFWYMRPTDPKNLAQKAFQALQKKCEHETCPCDVEKYAPNDLCQCTYEKNILWILKQGADLDCVKEGENLLEYASRQGYLNVVKYLVGLGFTLEKTRAVSVASYISTVDFLDKKGVPLDSALEHQLLRVVKAVKIYIDHKQGRWADIYEVSRIIRFLRNRGITREPQLAPHYIDFFNRWAKCDFTTDDRLQNLLKIYEDWSVTVKSKKAHTPFFAPTALGQGGIDPFNFHASNRAAFFFNYRKLKAISLGLAFTTLSLASLTFLTLKKKPLQALLYAIETVFVSSVWYFQPNDPKNLAREAFEILKERKYECTTTLEKGADLDLRFSFDPQLPPENLLEYASRQGYEQTVEYLVGLGFNLTNTRALHVAAYPHIVKFLAKKGVPIDSVENEQSPLESHLIRLLEAVQNFLDAKNEKFPNIEYEWEIIAFLLEKGAKKISQEKASLCQEITRFILSSDAVQDICIQHLRAARAGPRSHP